MRERPTRIYFKEKKEDLLKLIDNGLQQQEDELDRAPCLGWRISGSSIRLCDRYMQPCEFSRVLFKLIIVRILSIFSFSSNKIAVTLPSPKGSSVVIMEEARVRTSGGLKEVHSRLLWVNGLLWIAG